MRAAGLIPLAEYPGTHRPWACRCMTCGSDTSPRLSGIKNGQGGCTSCGTARRADLRRIPDATARRIMVAARFLPDAEFPYPGSDTPWPGRCLTCGTRRSPRLSGVKEGGRACRRCVMMESGVNFDIWAPALVYVIRHDKHRALKIGITSQRNQSTRLSAHRADGWVLVKSWKVHSGQHAVFVEGEILRWWRDELHERPKLKRAEMPQGGWTETIRIDAVTLEELVRRVSIGLKKAQLLPPLPAKYPSTPLMCIATRGGERCTKEAWCKNYCHSHYARWRKHGDPWGGRWPTTATACIVEVDGSPCGRPIRSNDMCSVHYERWYTYGDPHFMKRPTPGTRSATCLVEDEGALCGKTVKAREMCRRHYERWRAKQA